MIFHRLQSATFRALQNTHVRQATPDLFDDTSKPIIVQCRTGPNSEIIERDLCRNFNRHRDHRAAMAIALNANADRRGRDVDAEEVALSNKRI
ncbi:unnamed protein product [Phytophthora lilii]|uniref:Unnamed protein product n=1 Tax=Phytophthora lilii TaxID=2077276 RepID=A0A9W6X8T5_9STRA|nr:unnamed protein product [Phytophthora lilii]